MHIDPWIYFQITVLTSQPGKQVVKTLEEGLKDKDLLRVRRLQVVEVVEDTESASPVDESGIDGKIFFR